MKSISLEKFLKKILTSKKIKNPVLLKGTADETQMLEKLCHLNITRQRLCEAWSWLIHDINETFYPYDVTDFFTANTLNYLIDNKISLNELGHLQLRNEWLQRIYDKDNSCIEAMQTIQARKKKN